MKPLKKEALAVLGLVISPDVGLVISLALLVTIGVWTVALVVDSLADRDTDCDGSF
jgi:hypothetical protein